MTALSLTKIMATDKDRKCGTFFFDTAFLGNPQISSMSRRKKYVTLITEENNSYTNY